MHATYGSRLAAVLAVRKSIARKRDAAAAAAMRQMRRAIQDHQARCSGLVAVVMATSESGESTRRTVERAIGKWRGSTIGGYLRGDDETYLFNFRCSKHRFGHLVGLLAGSQLDLAPERTTHVVGRHGRRVRAAHTARDPPELRFKVAMCMYALGHEGSTKVKADTGSIGESTLRGWLDITCSLAL